MKKLFPIVILLCAILCGCDRQQGEATETKAESRQFLTEHYRCIVREDVRRDTLVGCTDKDALHAAVILQNKDTMCAVLRYVINHQPAPVAEQAVGKALREYYEQSEKKASMKRMKASVAADYAAKGDNALAKRYLLASMQDTIPGRWQIVKDVDGKGKRVAQILLANNDCKNATQTYLANLQTCDSILVTISHAQKEEVGRLWGKFENILLYIGIAALLIGMVWLWHALKRRYLTHVKYYESELVKMRDEVEVCQTVIDKLEASNNSSEREIRMLEEFRDSRQERLMERIAKGKVVYDLVKAAKPMPVMMKDADMLLIDYCLMMEAEHYDALRKQFGMLSPRLFTYLILTDMGHSDATIQEILSISPSSVRSLKSRLNARRKS